VRLGLIRLGPRRMARYYKVWDCCECCYRYPGWHESKSHAESCIFCLLMNRARQTFTEHRRVQAKDISDHEFYAAMTPMKYPGLGVSIWELEERLPYPRKVILAKARTLIRKRKTIDGCVCGCRGDFEFVKNDALEHIKQIIADRVLHFLLTGETGLERADSLSNLSNPEKF
jgi:hypothetical protein